MRQKRFRLLFMLLLTLLLPCTMAAQSWDFVKEKNGIKIYTRTEEGKSLKSYKGTADVMAPAEKVFAVIEDVNNTDWWDKNFSQIRVLLYEKNKKAQYYLVYNLPWPVTDRDLCVDVSVSIDKLTGTRKIVSGPLPGVIPITVDKIRITEYRQTWTVQPAGKESAHVTLEGFLDPAGSIPDWISNMIIVDSPLQVITSIKQKLEKK